MKSAREYWATFEMFGPSLVAGSIILAMTVILFWGNLIVVSPTAAARLASQVRLAPNHKHDATIASLLLPPFRNITGKVIDEMARNGTGPCYNQHTNSTKVVGFPDDGDVLTLPTNVLHQFWLQSYDSSGERRCAGGDYYELDLSSSLWKSRPPIHDLHNGTYAVQFMVPDAYAGAFSFSAYLLFDAYHGLDLYGQAFQNVKLAASLRINFVTPANISDRDSTEQVQTTNADNLPTLKRCNPATDFAAHEWSGRWTRPVDNDMGCNHDNAGRYGHCFSNSDAIPCRNPSWCSGDVSSLESVGWSYSAHCAFRIFAAQEAWDCLAGRWLFFWGDSNHQDTIRNLLNFVLQIQPPPGREFRNFWVDRSFQNWFRNPANLEQEVRITSHFNGHSMVDRDGEGLDSLRNPQYHEFVANFFRAKQYPDTMIMNSGLHDGHHRDIPSYVTSVEYALTFWSNVFGNATGKPPQLLYRTTVAPAGTSRTMNANPHKMEVYNGIITEMVQARFPDVKIVDAFDISFPFHYDNTYSDGGHYGRPPDPGRPHHYFVDIMVAHALLNALCPAGA